MTDDDCVIHIAPMQIELMDLKRNVIPEPFGLRPLQLALSNNEWQPVS